MTNMVNKGLVIRIRYSYPDVNGILLLCWVKTKYLTSI